jgi:uncharacterized membrane protein YbhN (UPF0104 family)
MGVRSIGIRRIISWLPLLILVLAIWSLGREFSNLRWSELVEELKRPNRLQIIQAVLLVVLNYMVYIAYDIISLRQLRQFVPLSLVAVAATRSWSLSNLVGYSMVSGLPIRQREYCSRGIGLKTVSGVILQNIEAWYLGFIFLIGIVFFTQDVAMVFEPLRGVSLKTVGLALLILILAYLIACASFSGRTLQLRSFTLYLPDLTGGVLKIFTGMLDILLTALTLVVLLPSDINLPFFLKLACYVISHAMGILSMVPGGLGVTEGVFLKILSSYSTQVSLLASFLVFRFIRYIIPAGLTVILELRFLTATVLRARRRAPKESRLNEATTPY